MAASEISFELIKRVREFYTMAYQEISSNERKQATPDNGNTDYAIPSYILSVAAVEAFVNESFIALGWDFLKGTSWVKLSQDEIGELSKKSLRNRRCIRLTKARPTVVLSHDEIDKFRERKRLGDKLIQFPKLAFDQDVFNRGLPPFQDMNRLIKVRDAFVHYKMKLEPEDERIEGIFDYLVKKGIALKSPNDSNRFWADDLRTIEGIRWAHNTALKIIKDIVDAAIKTNRHQILISMGTRTPNFFHQIPDPHQEKQLWLAWLGAHYNWQKVEKNKAG
jgi:hypothetical protein